VVRVFGGQRISGTHGVLSITLRRTLCKTLGESKLFAHFNLDRDEIKHINSIIKEI
jgi:hypothetical protein